MTPVTGDPFILKAFETPTKLAKFLEIQKSENIYSYQGITRPSLNDKHNNIKHLMKTMFWTCKVRDQNVDHLE